VGGCIGCKTYEKEKYEQCMYSRYYAYAEYWLDLSGEYISAAENESAPHWAAFEQGGVQLPFVTVMLRHGTNVWLPLIVTTMY